MRSFALVSLLILILGCSTSRKLSKEEQADFENAGYICKGVEAKQTFVYTISSRFQPQTGTRIKQAAREESQFNESVNFVVNNWIYHLLAQQYRLNAKGELNWGVKLDSYVGAYHSDFRSSLVWPSQYPLLRTEGNSFVLFYAPIDGLVDPVTGRKVSDSRSNLEEWKYNRYQYADEMNFYGGSFLKTHYFSIPTRDKASLCKKSGFESDCFSFPSSHRKIRQICSGSMGAISHTFLMRENGNCDHENAIDSRTELIEKMKNNTELRLQYESAIAADLFLKIGTKTTIAFKDGWKVHRLEWDPGLFCKYKRPVSDFYVQ